MKYIKITSKDLILNTKNKPYKMIFKKQNQNQYKKNFPTLTDDQD